MGAVLDIFARSSIQITDLGNVEVSLRESGEGHLMVKLEKDQKGKQVWKKITFTILTLQP